MNPSVPTSDTSFELSIEVMLLILGAIMTIAMIAIAIWLFRKMQREDRERQREESHGDGA